MSSFDSIEIKQYINNLVVLNILMNFYFAYSDFSYNSTYINPFYILHFLLLFFGHHINNNPKYFTLLIFSIFFDFSLVLNYGDGSVMEINNDILLSNLWITLSFFYITINEIKHTPIYELHKLNEYV